MAGWLPAAHSQIQVAIRAKHTRYLQYEPLEIVVTIRNELSTPLLMDNGGDTVFAFDIETSPGEPVASEGRSLLSEPWRIEPWKTDTKSFNLIRSYPIRKQGPHRVIARVTLGGMDFQSNRLMIDILPGMEVVRVVGVAEDGSRRVFRLRTLVRGRYDYAFLQIENEAGGVNYEAQDLGTIVRFFAPQMRVSSDGTIHVLHQSAPARYTHSVTTMEGRPVSTRFYSALGGGEVKLVEDRRGRLRPDGVGPYKGDPVVDPVRVPETLLQKK
jgi:hypothetical protein